MSAPEVTTELSPDAFKPAFAKRIGGVWVLLIAMLIIGGILEPRFVSGGNLRNVFVAGVPLLLLAVGQSFVLFTAEIDLSVGSIVTLSAIIVGEFMNNDPALIVPVVVLALAAGGLVGLFNGFVVSMLGVPSFVVTLGSLLMVRGLVLVWTGGGPRSNLPEEIRFVSEARLFGIPIGAVLVVLVAVTFAWVITHRAHLGRKLLFVGSNAEAARLAGIRVARVKTMAFILSGVFAAAAGIYITARIGSVRGDQGAGLELDAIAAAVLGGVSLFGGRGRVMMAVGGAAVLGVILNLLILLGYPLQAQQIGKGVILIAAILIYQRGTSETRSRSRLRKIWTQGRGQGGGGLPKGLES